MPPSLTSSQIFLRLELAVLVWWGKSVKFDRVCGTFFELNLASTHGLNQVSPQWCSKVKLIQLGSTCEKYSVWTRPCNAYPGSRRPSIFHDKIEGPWERYVANRLVKQSHSCTEVKSCKQSITSLNGNRKCCNFVVAIRRWLFHDAWTRMVRKFWSRWLSCQSKQPFQRYFI